MEVPNINYYTKVEIHYHFHEIPTIMAKPLSISGNDLKGVTPPDIIKPNIVKPNIVKSDIVNQDPILRNDNGKRLFVCECGAKPMLYNSRIRHLVTSKHETNIKLKLLN